MAAAAHEDYPDELWEPELDPKVQEKYPSLAKCFYWLELNDLNRRWGTSLDPGDGRLHLMKVIHMGDGRRFFLLPRPLQLWSTQCQIRREMRQQGFPVYY